MIAMGGKHLLSKPTHPSTRPPLTCISHIIASDLGASGQCFTSPDSACLGSKGSIIVPPPPFW